jgi:hypothetical protein
VVVVRIDRWRGPRRIGQDVERIRADAKPPRLGVVTVGSERGVSDQIPDGRVRRQGRTQLIGVGRVVLSRADSRTPAEGAAARKQGQAACSKPLRFDVSSRLLLPTLRIGGGLSLTSVNSVHQSRSTLEEMR